MQQSEGLFGNGCRAILCLLSGYDKKEGGRENGGPDEGWQKRARGCESVITLHGIEQMVLQY